MTKRSFVFAAFLLALSAVTALAADVTGNWSGQFAGPNGDVMAIVAVLRDQVAMLNLSRVSLCAPSFLCRSPLPAGMTGRSLVC